jgi:AcrR family transcriptional regulator
MTSIQREEQPERRRRSDGERSRAAILEEAGRLATVEGIDGLSIGRLADAVGISKSGLFAHFGSKEELQLATVDAAHEVLQDMVLRPSEQVEGGLERLRAYCENFLRYVDSGVFPGGCFFSSVAVELGAKTGAVRDAAVAVVGDFYGRLVAAATAARDEGSIDAALDPEQLAFEIDAYLFLANAQYAITGDAAALERARAAVAARLSAAGSR